MPTPLIDALFSAPEMAAVFSDTRLLDGALVFERELAAVEAELGIIPAASAAAIARACVADGIDLAALGRDTQRAGTLAIPLVKFLTARVAAIDPGAAGDLHLGATSQDVADTALALILRDANELLEAQCGRLARAALALAEHHRATPMLGRTLLQPGPPITFGLKAANWLMGLVEAGERLAAAKPAALQLQFGGAVGSLAGLGNRGIEVAEKLGSKLGLSVPSLPAHSQPGGIIALGLAAGQTGLVAAKIARDISLLMQFEVGEASEPGGGGRGGSSTMPHKRNPIASMIAISSATRLPGLMGTLAACALQEHERAVGGWQAELPVLRDIYLLSASALAAMTEALEGLVVDRSRMAANIEQLGGLIFAERVMLALAPHVGRGMAHGHMEALVAKAVATHAPLLEVALADALVIKTLPRETIVAAFDPTTYLGSSLAFVDRALARARSSPVLAGV